MWDEKQGDYPAVSRVTDSRHGDQVPHGGQRRWREADGDNFTASVLAHYCNVAARVEAPEADFLLRKGEERVALGMGKGAG